jgi:solute carrier family 35 protein F1/2
MLLGSLTIPVVMALSWFLLRARYGLLQLVGAFMCLCGLALLVWTDWRRARADGGGSAQTAHSWLGDALCVAAAVCYAITNVGQEALVKGIPACARLRGCEPGAAAGAEARLPFQYLCFVGLFGAALGSAQAAALEHAEWPRFASCPTSLAYLFAFALALFAFYSAVPHLLRIASATLMNLSLLTSNLYGALISVFVFGGELSLFYFVSLALVVLGILVYHLRLPTPDKQPEAQPVATSGSSSLLLSILRHPEQAGTGGSSREEESLPLVQSPA